MVLTQLSVLTEESIAFLSAKCPGQAESRSKYALGQTAMVDHRETCALGHVRRAYVGMYRHNFLLSSANAVDRVSGDRVSGDVQLFEYAPVYGI